MEFRKMTNNMVRHAIDKCETGQVSVDTEYGALKLNERVGKFFQAALTHDKKCRPEKFVAIEEARRRIADSLAGVMEMAVVNAHLYDVDIERAIRKKWLKEQEPLKERVLEFHEIMAGMVSNAMNYGEVHNVLIDRGFGILKLGEEVAEFSEAVLVHDRKCQPEDYLTDEDARNRLAEELADVIGMVAVNAHLYDIDIEQIIKNYL